MQKWRILNECSCIIEFINQLEKAIRREALPSFLSVSLNEFDKFNNKETRMQDSTDHMIIKSHLIADLLVKNVKISPLKNSTFYGRQRKTNPGNCIFNSLVDYRVFNAWRYYTLIYATPYDKW